MAKCRAPGCKNDVDSNQKYCSPCMNRFLCIFPGCKNKVEGGKSFCSSCLSKLMKIEEGLSTNKLLSRLHELEPNERGYVPKNWKEPIVVEVGVLSIDSFMNFVTPSGIKPKNVPPNAIDVLKEALGILQKVINEKHWRSKHPWKGILVAPELFFHRDETLKEKNLKDYQPREKEKFKIDTKATPHRCLEDDQFKKLMTECGEISEAFPQILIIPGSFLYRQRLSEYRKEAIDSAIRSVMKHELHGIWVTQKYTLDDSSPSLAFAGTGFTFKNQKDEFITTGNMKGKVDYVRDTASDMFEKIDKYKYMIRNSAFGFFNGFKVFAYHKNGLNADINGKDDNRSKTVFVSGGLSNIVLENFFGCRIGMEICQDHDLGLFKKLHEEEDEVDLHIIASGHVDIRPHFSCASSDGYVIHSDIKTDWNNKEGYSKVYQFREGVNRKELDDKLQVVQDPKNTDEKKESELLEKHVVPSRSVRLKTQVAQNTNDYPATLKLCRIALLPGAKKKKI